MTVTRIMGIDIGEKRVGVALSDPLGLTAQPHAVIEYTGPENLIRQLLDIAAEYEVGKIIAGVPYGLDGQKGESAEKILAFIRRLEENTDIEIETADERFSTAFSQKAMIEADASRKKRRRNIDKVAAAVILQGYLDSRGER